MCSVEDARRIEEEEVPMFCSTGTPGGSIRPDIMEDLHRLVLSVELPSFLRPLDLLLKQNF